MTEELLPVEFDKWVVYGHDTDYGGADFEYLLSGPSAHLKHDDGCLKMRRRSSGVAVGLMVTTHGKRQALYEHLLGAENEDELRAFMDGVLETFMLHYKAYPLQWGRYTE